MSAVITPLPVRARATPPYAELHCLSDFSFGRGASTALELFERAKALGYGALAITDECTMSGIVRALQASEATGVALIVGAEFTLDDGLKLVLLAQTQAGYSAICRLITVGRRRADKGRYALAREDFSAGLPDVLALWVPGRLPDDEHGLWVRAQFPGRAWLAIELHRGADDTARLAQLQALSARLDLPAVAAGDAHMHVRSRRALQDVLTAVRHHRTVADAGAFLFPNGERHLRTPRALRAIYPRALLDESARIAAMCSFNLRALNYRYPHELVPAGKTPRSYLRRLSFQGIRWRWPDGAGKETVKRIRDELRIITSLGYESFFLTVHDIVRFARGQGILCQGRGSAANSAVCYCLGVTSVSPTQTRLLFGRFLSVERREPPDIDVDFEHERREEVLQYVYGKYGRDRTALAATVIRYQGASAITDVARALGLPSDQIALLSSMYARGNGHADLEVLLRERGFDPDSRVLQQVLELTGQVVGSPRHLSQHVGGFVISEAPLHELVPVENAAMDDRTIIQWDKDDLEELGLLKVDCLALGMLTAVSKCFALLEGQRGRSWSMATIPPEDPETFAMIQRAGTVGVFQIESRAQMAMLPRLRPATFYDLVIQVAIVRPGPIQGGMVHPYLKRRKDASLVDYPSDALKTVLERTLGVPLFQEQVMEIAMVAGGYSAGEADGLRKSMAAWKRHGGLEHHRQRLQAGMAERGYAQEFIDRIFEQIKGFGSYGFPESHAASFALITYVSCWLKCHEPAAFICALINSLPMGFYSVDDLVQDVRRLPDCHKAVAVRPVDALHSDWDCTLEDVPDDRVRQPALRLGLRTISGFREDVARQMMDARTLSPWRDVEDLCERAGLDARHRSLLADAGALRQLAGHRHRARWAVDGVEAQLPLFAGLAVRDDPVHLPVPTTGQDMLADYRTTGLTLGAHPLSLLRRSLAARRCVHSRDYGRCAHGRSIRLAGLVTMRQRPQTASGITFVTLQDEFGMVNVVVWRQVGEDFRRILLESELLMVEGRVETSDGVRHLIARRMENYSALLGQLRVGSRNFR
jgi:error-prone DNA polymerase